MTGIDKMCWGSAPALGADTPNYASYLNKNITYRGEIANMDYMAILQDKQGHIKELYALSDYFCDADAIYGGIIKNVYAPFSVCSGWKLDGGSEAAKKRFLDVYRRIDFDTLMSNAFYEYHKYAQVYWYVLPDGKIIDLPQSEIVISDVVVNGEPVLEWDLSSYRTQTATGIRAKPIYIDTTKNEYKGFPDEVAEGLNHGESIVQLNPANTFVWQGVKENWAKYAVPLAASCLEDFANKALIRGYEQKLLNLGMRSFLQVQVGDKDVVPIVDKTMITQVEKTYKSVINGNSLAVVPWVVDSKYVIADLKEIFQVNNYANVNSNILSAGGISAMVVSGTSEGSSSYAEAKISVETAAKRIVTSQNKFSAMMRKINQRLSEIFHIGGKIPQFVFNPIDLMNSAAFRDAAFKLWTQGVISTTTLQEVSQYDPQQELERRKRESQMDYAAIFAPPQNAYTSRTGNEAGAPEKSEEQSKTDKSHSQTMPRPGMN